MVLRLPTSHILLTGTSTYKCTNLFVMETLDRRRKSSASERRCKWPYCWACCNTEKSLSPSISRRGSEWRRLARETMQISPTATCCRIFELSPALEYHFKTFVNHWRLLCGPVIHKSTKGVICGTSHLKRVRFMAIPTTSCSSCSDA